MRADDEKLRGVWSDYQLWDDTHHSTEVAPQIPADSLYSEDVYVRVVVYPGRPFTSEKAPICRINALLESCCQCEHIVPIELHVLLDP